MTHSRASKRKSAPSFSRASTSFAKTQKSRIELPDGAAEILAHNRASLASMFGNAKHSQAAAPNFTTAREFETWLRSMGLPRAAARAVTSHGFRGLDPTDNTAAPDTGLADAISQLKRSTIELRK